MQQGQVVVPQQGYYLLNGADINCKDVAKESPLIEAAEAGHTAMVKLLIDKGADVDYVRRVGWCAFGLRHSKSNCEDIANLLGYAPRRLEEESAILLWMAGLILKERIQLLL